MPHEIYLRDTGSKPTELSRLNGMLKIAAVPHFTNGFSPNGNQSVRRYRSYSIYEW